MGNEPLSTRPRPPRLQGDAIGPDPTRALRHDAVRRGIPSGRVREGAAAAKHGAGEWSVGGNPAGVTVFQQRDPGAERRAGLPGLLEKANFDEGESASQMSNTVKGRVGQG